MTTSVYEELTEPVLRRLLRPGDYQDDPLAQSIPKQERYAVHAAMKKLSPYHHKLMTLRYLQNYDLQRTAQELLISPTIVAHPASPPRRCTTNQHQCPRLRLPSCQ